MDRRKFLKLGISAAGATLMTAPLVSQALDVCAVTPEQVKGPFYPLINRDDENTDLTQINGSTEKATGEIHYLNGRILNEDCAPLSGALVEIWQACHTGRYDHERDSDNPAALDPNFQYWGETLTNDLGEFKFKTIKPGSYAADIGWDRPPHIHVKVSKRGYKELITQLYFKGEALNDIDRILQALTIDEQNNLVVDFKTAEAPLEEGAKVGSVEITLHKIR